jgi:hypothetical protein
MRTSCSQATCSYLSLHQLLPPNQSGFRTDHSTESDIIKVLSDLLDAVNRGDSAALALLDMSAAFDTVDDAIRLDRLCIPFGVYAALIPIQSASVFFVVAVQLPVLPTSAAYRKGRSLGRFCSS